MIQSKQEYREQEQNRLEERCDMKHKKYLPVMATVSAVILLAGCRGIKDTGDKESIMEKSRLLAAEDTTVESTR